MWQSPPEKIKSSCKSFTIANEIEFELIQDKVLFYWQPMCEILIKPKIFTYEERNENIKNFRNENYK